MHLQNLQLEFLDALLEQSTDNHLPVHPATHLAIYRHQIQVTLMNTLMKTYPLITQLIGQDFFQITAKEYIKHYPARNHQLNDYGAYFSDFLAEYEPLHDLIYLVEVAQFEWLCHTLKTAADHAPMAADGINSILPEQYSQLHFTLNPASHLQRFYYPILRIIDICQSQRASETLDVDAGGVNLLLLRQDQTITLTPLSHAEFTFLDMLAEGKNVAESTNTTLLIDAQFDFKEKINFWCQQQLLVGYHL